MRFFDQLGQQARSIVRGRVVPLKELPGREHYLVRRLSPTTAPPHAVCQNRQHATVVARMGEQSNLVLLVLPVSLVDARGRSKAVSLAHMEIRWKYTLVWRVKAVLSNQAPSSFGGACAVTQFNPLDSNLHSPQRRLIELRMEHSDLDAMIDRIGLEAPLDELMLRRLKKRRLSLRDEIIRVERQLTPSEPA